MPYLEVISPSFKLFNWKSMMELWRLVAYEGGFIRDIFVTEISGNIKGLFFP